MILYTIEDYLDWYVMTQNEREEISKEIITPNELLIQP